MTDGEYQQHRRSCDRLMKIAVALAISAATILFVVRLSLIISR